jgi:putative FmdB family regulatory protein
MPIYEYQCPKCGQQTEILHQSQERKRPVCRECGGRMKKMISSSAFILKGSGWYVTDYPSTSRKEGMEAEKKAKEKKKKKDTTSKKKPSAASTSGKSSKKRSRRGA